MKRPVLLRAGILLLLLLLAGACAPSPTATPASTPVPTTALRSSAAPTPTGQYAKASTWTTGAKIGVGTAFTYDQPAGSNSSRVWFTVTRGALTDLLYPELDQPNLRELKFLISDGQKLYDETADLAINVTRPDPKALFWQIESTPADGSFKLVKTVVADPDSNTVMMQAQLQPIPANAGKLHLYAYLVPLLAGTGRGNKLTLDFATHRAGITSQRVSAELITDVPWLAATAGYLRVNDGMTDLQSNKKLTLAFDSAVQGDYPTLTVELPVEKPLTLALGFGATPQDAANAASASLQRGYQAVEAKYRAGWNAYCATIDNLGGQANDEYFASAMLLRAAEDKDNRGAVIASFSVPWGDGVLDRPEDRASFVGYRRVWARDAYHTALGLWAAGDTKTAQAILTFLQTKQQKPDGSFPQNTYLDGTVSWTGTQMDETADPILLAWRLGAQDRYTTLVKPAADFLVKEGPQTPQERWEEAAGYSPATLAAEIAALAAAADMGQKAGDSAGAKTYADTARAWAKNIEGWSYTHTGTLGTAGYFLRISPAGKPDAQDYITLANSGATVDQRSVVDPSFLELVRLGVLKPDDPRVVATLPVIDKLLRSDTANGPSWHRYPGDRYGEQERGMSTVLLTKGHAWPLLTGERGMYELAAGNRAAAVSDLAAMGKFANMGGLIPEQVWEDTGQGTGSATPLLWAHSEYLLLFKSLQAGQVLDRPAVVTDFFK